MANNLITVTFTQWEKWQPRKDIKHPTWFAMSNRITEDDQIQALSDTEFRVFVHIFCLASQGNGPTAVVNLEKAERVLGKKKRIFRETIDKLCAFGICTRSDVCRTDDVRDPSATIQDKTIQDKTIQDSTLQDTTPQDCDGGLIHSPTDLANLWNSETEKVQVFVPTKSRLPAVDVGRLKPSQARHRSAKERIQENPSREYWVSVIAKITASDGCRGRNDRHWLADFDFLVRPDTHIKALEGKYDTWGAPRANTRGPPAGALQRDINADLEIQEIMNEVLGESAS